MPLRFCVYDDENGFMLPPVNARSNVRSPRKQNKVAITTAHAVAIGSKYHPLLLSSVTPSFVDQFDSVQISYPLGVSVSNLPRKRIAVKLVAKVKRGDMLWMPYH